MATTPITASNIRIRKSFAKNQVAIEIPNLIELQKKSYESFLLKNVDPDKREGDGLNGVFKSVFPISDFNNTASLEFVSYVLEPPKYDINSNMPLKAVFDQFYWPVLINDKVIVHNDAFLGKHFFAMIYSNRLELIRAFVLGTAHYRPDITIDPAIFVKHYIDRENYVINYRQRRQIQFFGFLFCVLILVILYFVVY